MNESNKKEIPLRPQRQVVYQVGPGKPTLCLFHPQDEEKLLLAVDEAQETLREQKQQLLEKEEQVGAAKAEVEQNTQSVQGLSRFEAQLHDSRERTFPSCRQPATLAPCPPPRQGAGEAPAGGDERGLGLGAEAPGQTQPAAGLQDPGAARHSAVGEPHGDQRGPGKA